jgi:hypothetical protein
MRYVAADVYNSAGLTLSHRRQDGLDRSQSADEVCVEDVAHLIQARERNLCQYKHLQTRRPSGYHIR